MKSPILKRKVSDGKYHDHTVVSPTCTVGRSRDCDITINDSSLSRLHFRLEDRNGTIFVVDNNSSNGTFLNKRKVGEAPLIHGDIVIAGRVQFTFFHEPEEGGQVTKPMPAIGSINATVSAELDSLNDGNIFDTGEDFESPIPPNVPDPQPPLPPPVPHAAPAEPVSTGSKVPPHLRLLAVLIDLAVGVVLVIPGMLVSVLFNAVVVGWLLQAMGGLLGIAHLAVGWTRYGKTVGKHQLGLKIETLDAPANPALPPKVVVLRLLGGFLSAATCGLLFLSILFDPEGRGVHDKIAGTRVVRDNPSF